jgi:hypothetical protein
VRRILPTAIATALLVGAFAGVASARLSNDAPPAPERAPLVAPAAMPSASGTHPGSYAFRSPDAIGAEISGAAEPRGSASSGGGSASIAVTATVLPVVIIVVDKAGDVTQLFTNTDERSARDVVYLVRRGDESGEAAALDADIWADARTAMKSAAAGTGAIWTA